ncbi:MAG TPA: PLP-dependent aminotransferase family protein [Burkholderiaceae bacterium]|nr:PLP-dependent aminotransferase family protein [Burkholderiaceae bacterium]
MEPTLSRRTRAIRRSDVRDLLRHAGRPGMVSLAGGLPAAELFDVEGLRAATLAALDDAPAAALQYGATEGQPALREAIAARLRERGVPAAADGLVVTTGSQQGLDLVARALLDEGDVVVVERPSYLAALQALGLAGPSWRSIAVDEAGGRVEDLDAACDGARPKLVYVVPDFANPTGACMSLERRRALVRWAARRGVVVLEDDPYGELRTRGEPLPSLAALAAEVPGASDWVGHASTLSKTVAPGLRVGWLLLPAWLREAVVLLKQASDLHTSTFAQEVACRYLASGRLPARLALVRAEYARRRDALADALARGFGPTLSVRVPDGGMFLWARFTDGTDARALLPLALERGVTFVPGDAFFVDAPDAAALRLNFSAVPPERLREGVRRLVDAHRAHRGRPGSTDAAASPAP